jgi:hypothetical protein
MRLTKEKTIQIQPFCRFFQWKRKNKTKGRISALLDVKAVFIDKMASIIER